MCLNASTDPYVNVGFHPCQTLYALQQRVVSTFKGQLWPLLLVYVPVLSYFALLRRILGMLVCLIAATIPSVNLGSHPIPHCLHYHRGYRGLLMCLNADKISSVNLGLHPPLILFALLQRLLGTVNVL